MTLTENANEIQIATTTTQQLYNVLNQEEHTETADRLLSMDVIDQINTNLLAIQVYLETLIPVPAP